MRHRRASVLQRTRREYAALDRLVKHLRPGDWKLRVPRRPGDDPWTVKDTLAHIVYWKEHSLRVFRGERRPTELRGLDVPRLNRVVWKRWRGRPVREIVAWHRRVHADALKTFVSLTDAWFGRREHSPEWPLDFVGHSEAHRKKDIEGALAARRKRTG
jgi:hypothetical protein